LPDLPTGAFFRRRAVTASGGVNFQLVRGHLLGNVAESRAVVLGVLTEQLEGAVDGEAVAFGEEPFGLLDDDPALKAGSA